MKNYFKLCLIALMGGLLIAASGCSKLEARDQLNRGVQAYRAAQFNEAISHFQRAIQLDPTLINAKLYLATAFQSQFTPGSPSPDNMRMATSAIDEYKVILDQNPKNANAVAGLARLNYDMGKLDEAQQYYERALTLSPNDPTAYYTLGAIAYQKTNKGIVLARQSLGVTDLNKPLITKKSNRKDRTACDDLAKQDTDTIDQGITQLKKALELRSDYADAMTYLNLLYREKADLSCGNDQERQANLKIADDYVAQGLAVRKAQVAAENKQSNSSPKVIMDQKQ